ncbi:MAG: S-layer homology domain-containing protein [Nitriliruptoraceae bacterium]
MSHGTSDLLRPAAIVTAAAAVLFGLPTIGAAPAEALPEGCAEELPSADYADRDDISAAHLEAVDCVTQLGIAQGLGSDEGEVYLPHADVRRDQMATFIVGLLAEADVALPVAEDPPFEDVSRDDVHAEAIAKLASAGIVSGVGDDRYAPAAPVRRDQMASFLVPALAYEAGVEDDDLQGGDIPLTDVQEGNVHRATIAGAFNVGITSGTSSERYSPASSVSREAMASFVVRSLEAMQQRVTVADRDGGGLPHTVFTFPSESGRCFQATAGDAWRSECEPATDERLQLRPVAIDDDYTVLAGLVTAEVSRVAIEYGDGASIDVDLTATGSDGLQAWASPILAADIDAVVAYDDGSEVARTMPYDDIVGNVPADVDQDRGDGIGEPVTLTDIEVAHHETFDRAVFEVSGGGTAGWIAEYVDEAVRQGSGESVEIAGEAILRLDLTNMAYPTETDLETYEPGTRIDGVDGITEVYVGTTFEGFTRLFLGLPAETPFRTFGLEDPGRVVVDVFHEDVS